MDAFPVPEVKWLKNGSEVSADARIKITRDSHRNETYNLTCDLVKFEDRGEYEVIVTNVYGTVNSKSTVTVQSKYYQHLYNKQTKNNPLFMNLFLMCILLREKGRRIFHLFE